MIYAEANPFCTPNDPDDADSGANNLQNFPILSSATTSRRSTKIKGTLNSAPDTTFTLRFYSNPEGTNEGKKFVGLKSVHTDAAKGEASFTFEPGNKVAAGQRITATAAELDSNTSEFSNPRRVVTP